MLLHYLFIFLTGFAFLVFCTIAEVLKELGGSEGFSLIYDVPVIGSVIILSAGAAGLYKEWKIWVKEKTGVEMDIIYDALFDSDIPGKEV